MLVRIAAWCGIESVSSYCKRTRIARQLFIVNSDGSAEKIPEGMREPFLDHQSQAC